MGWGGGDRRGAIGRRLGWDKARGGGDGEGQLEGEDGDGGNRKGRREGAKRRGRRRGKRRGHFTDGYNGMPGWICATGLSCKQIGLGRRRLYRSLTATSTCNALVE